MGLPGLLAGKGYSGFNELYRAGSSQEVACLAHIRRKFVDIVQSQASPIAEAAIKRVAGLYAVEKQARGQPPERRVELRRANAKPILDELEAWLEAQLPPISGKPELAKAIRYALARLKKLRPYLDHGCLEADNNAAERAMKSVASAESLCPSSSSAWKHWKLVGRGLVTRAALAGERRCDALSSEVFSPNLPWCARHHCSAGSSPSPMSRRTV